MSIIQSIINFIKWLCGAAEYKLDRYERRKRGYTFKKDACREKGMTVSGQRGLRRKW